VGINIFLKGIDELLGVWLGDGNVSVSLVRTGMASKILEKNV
jgi:hypothetical protein